MVDGCGCAAPVAVAPIGKENCNSFLLLLLLFILLASCCVWGIESRYFFIIILAVIAFGGVGRTFGFGI